MRSFLTTVLLSCFVSLFVFGDQAMGQLRRSRSAASTRSAPAAPQPKEVYYNGVKLGVDTPLTILEEAQYSDPNGDDDTVQYAAQFYRAQCQLLGYNGAPKDEKSAEETFRSLFILKDIGGTNRANWYGIAIPPSGRNQRAFPPSVVNVSFTDRMTEYIDRVRKNAEQGNAEDQIKLGIYYTLAMGVPSNSRETVKWIRQAADQGNTEAQLLLADFYAEGYGGLPVSSTESVKWVQRAADQGDETAQGMVETFQDMQARQRQIQKQRQAERRELLLKAAIIGGAIAIGASR